MGLVRTVMSVMVHRADDNPMLGREAMQVSIEDEGAGVYFRLIDGAGGELCITLEELEEVCEAARGLYQAYPAEHRAPRDAGDGAEG